MSVLFDKIKKHFHNQLPFVCYCKPNSDTIISLFQKDDELFPLNEDAGFAYVSFDNEKRYCIPENQSDIYFEKHNTTDYIFSNESKNTIDENAKTHFEKLVENAVKSIENGAFEKVVLSRKELISITNFDLELVFKKLVFHYPTAFKYCFYHSKIGLWMGASPEQFLKTSDNLLQTIALAGTQLYVENQKTKWNEKEISEQQVVTDFIVSNLKKFVDVVKVSQPYTAKAGSIVHIKTEIEAQINGIDCNSIIENLHPTPAVCGFPKEIAKTYILKNEGYDREFYAGFLGEWKKDFLTFKENQSDLFVNLRCMKITETNAELFIGCGINKASNPEKEFLETVNKSMIMKKVL